MDWTYFYKVNGLDFYLYIEGGIAMEYTVRRLPEELGCLPLQGVFAPEAIPAPYAALEEAVK